MSIYTANEIIEMFYNIQELIENCTDLDEIQTLLNVEEMAKMELSTKLENIAMVIKNLESNVVGKKGEIKRLSESVKYEENAIKRLKEYAQYLMITTGQTKVKGKKFTFSFRKSTSVKIEDETLIPPQFIKTETKIIKTDLSKALKNGEEIAGAKLVENQSLSIR